MKRHLDALGIIDPGACNPRGIVRSLLEAIEEAAAEDGSTDAICNDAACRLIVHQLANVMGVFHLDRDLTEFGQCVEECRRWKEAKAYVPNKR